ncbi:MAG TPA: DUF6529 family protein [Acidimicrobiales bacterium]|nr:DUF6529 family protein [Acidimicrobiales bacterium]
MATSTPTPAARSSVLRVFVPFAVAAVVAVTLGSYGRVHDPAGQETITLFFTRTLNFKAWATTVALALAVFQIASAARLYGRFPYPRAMPAWYGQAHRLSGTLAFACTLPVAFHCLWSLGFQDDLGNLRTFVHSVAGCFFFGIFAAKVLTVRARSMPGWALPLIGSLVFTALVVLWSTSSLWFFRHQGFPSF